MKTIVLITTQTSATGSIWRIIEKLAGDKYKLIGFDPEKQKIVGDKFERIPQESTIFLHNRPGLLKYFNDPDKYRFIVNFRDPRDRLCNSFYWMQQHPRFPGEPKNDIKMRADEIIKQGINQWVKDNINPEYEKSLVDFVGRLSNRQKCIATYASLCLDFDVFVKTIAEFLGVELEEQHWELLEIERVEEISNNPKWIGGSWAGSDIMPGRYKRELSPTTINYLGNIYEEVLRGMASLDSDNSALYLENIDINPNKYFQVLSNIFNAPSPDILREVAFAFEQSGDIETALKIMEKAHLLRPTGPLIKRKLDEYCQFLAEQK